MARNFLPMIGCCPGLDETDILYALQMQCLPYFRGCRNLKGKLFKNAANFPDLLGITRRLDARSEIEVVFQTYPDICTHDDPHGQKGHLAVACAQYGKVIGITSE